MTETQREAAPAVDDGEPAVALAFLDFARHCALKKLDGLTEEQQRRVLVPSGTSLLGLVRHLTVGERWWFGYHFDAGYPDQEWDFEMAVPPGASADAIIADYRAAVLDSNAVIARLGDFDTPTARSVGAAPRSLRWVVAHMTSEVARHAGHADILREIIDGTIGMRTGDPNISPLSEQAREDRRNRIESDAQRYLTRS
jgi:hypothetical protein